MTVCLRWDFAGSVLTFNKNIFYYRCRKFPNSKTTTWVDFYLSLRGQQGSSNNIIRYITTGTSLRCPLDGFKILGGIGTKQPWIKHVPEPAKIEPVSIKASLNRSIDMRFGWSFQSVFTACHEQKTCCQRSRYPWPCNHHLTNGISCQRVVYAGESRSRRIAHC